MSKYQEILLSKIFPNPRNPRKNFEGPSFNELVESIRSKGVIEPIIVRPVSNGKTDIFSDNYEVVAGERRFRASCLINKDLDQAKIPAVIRELSDDEAFDFMIIENLQREDLTGFEEAMSFKQYFEKKGKGSVPELAQRIGKTAGYIRRKISTLSLPDYILKSWEKEDLTFSHLEQLQRLKNKEDLKDSFEFATGKRRWGKEEPASKRSLKDYIDKMSPLLELVYFDLEKEGCLICGQNSDIQKKEFEIEGMKGAHCLDKKCFKKKQNNFLQGHWKETEIHKKLKTNGFRFNENINYNDYESFERSWGPKPAKKCFDCENFLTILDPYGLIKVKRACFKPSCYNTLGRQKTVDNIKTERQKRVERGGPRITWHGEHFRENFLQKRIPERYQEFGHDHIKIYRIILFSFLKSARDNFQDIKTEFQLKNDFPDKELFQQIEKMNLDKILEIMKQFALKIIKGWPVSHEGRLEIAEYIGIDLFKEFAVTKEYLDKKTIGEMLEFGEKSGIFKSKKVQDYLILKLKKKPGQFNKCKKTEIIDLFIKSGVDLAGKIPDEIIPKQEKK